MNDLVKSSRGLTDRQALFVEKYVAQGGHGYQAAIDAGYSADSARCAYTHLMSLPHIRAAIHVEIEKRIKCDMASLALGTMRRLMTDTDTPAHVQFQAARFVLETAGHKATEPTRADKPLSEMTMVELAEFIADAKSRLDKPKPSVIDAVIVSDCPQTESNAQGNAQPPSASVASDCNASV